MAGIYIHIPFCKKACHYCNFHFSTNLGTKDLLLDSICKEITLKQHLLPDKTIESVYFGGGTPSMLNQIELDSIINTLHRYYTIKEKAEITLEANPDDLSKEVVTNLLNSGINRLSIGVQSFFDKDLAWMGRAHTSQQAEACIQDVQDTGIHNLSIDLIYGSPTTTNGMWEENLQKAVKFEIPHISSYCLTVEEHTALSHQIRKGKTVAPNTDHATDQFEVLMEFLENASYDHYETSNFAKEGFIAVHNTNYWKGTPYLGFGPSAHSYIHDIRSWNIAHNMKYIESIQNGIVPQEREELTTEMKYNEYIMTGLRTKWGIQKSHIASLGDTFSVHLEKNIRRSMFTNLIIETDGMLQLTRAGKYYADRIAMELFIDT
jgi:oxygen-independent coproporphyrinogen-3 oxidase